MNKGGENLIAFSGLTLELAGENQPFAGLQVKKTNRKIRYKFTDDQLRRFYGSGDQLFHCASFPLPGNTNRGKQRGNNHNNHGNHTGNNKPGAG